MNYLVTVSDETNDSFVAYAYGDFDTIRYASKQALGAIAEKTGDFRARIVEASEVGVEPDESARVVCSVGGDAETVTVVLKKKIATERKRLNPAAESPASGETDAE